MAIGALPVPRTPEHLAALNAIKKRYPADVILDGAIMSSEEITPEMAEAGVSAVAAIQWDFDTFEEIAIAIFKAMHEARTQSAIIE